MQDTGLRTTGLEFVAFQGVTYMLRILFFDIYFTPHLFPQKIVFLPQSNSILINGTTINLVAQAPN